jgi:small subunit ribosomal protein S18
VALLRHFVTPTGQIRNRVQTRLGARDQRRVARLIRRARCLGLIPYQGQFKVERHGWVHAPDIREDRPWEKELKRRGLEIQARRQRRRESNNKEQEGSKQLS